MLGEQIFNRVPVAVNIRAVLAAIDGIWKTRRVRLELPREFCWQLEHPTDDWHIALPWMVRSNVSVMPRGA